MKNLKSFNDKIINDIWLATSIATYLNLTSLIWGWDNCYVRFPITTTTDMSSKPFPITFLKGWCWYRNNNSTSRTFWISLNIRWGHYKCIKLITVPASSWDSRGLAQLGHGTGCVFSRGSSIGSSSSALERTKRLELLKSAGHVFSPQRKKFSFGSL